MMFKPGDRVVRTGPSREEVHRGWTYVVLDVENRGAQQWLRLFKDGGFDWDARYFTLAPPVPSPVDPEAWEREREVDDCEGRWSPQSLIALALLGFLRHFRVAYGTRPRVELPEPWQPMETCPERLPVLIADSDGHTQVLGSTLRQCDERFNRVAWCPLPPHPYKGGGA